MKKCPRCKNFSVEYDPYRGVNICTVYGCGCIIEDEKTYSYLKTDPSTKTVSRVRVAGDTKSIIKTYKLE